MTTLSELERHCHDEGKHAGYERLLKDFGIDAERFAALAAHPRLVLAEQPGCWFFGDDLMRYRLLERIRESIDFHPSSGVLSLADDSFTCRGMKKLILQLQFHPGVEPVFLLGASFIRRQRNRIYSALKIEDLAFERLAEIFEICVAMIDAARISADAFADVVTSIFQAGVRPGIRPLLPARCDKRSLRELGERFRRCDLEAARRPLAMARRRLRRGLSWSTYWDGVNEDFYGARIANLGPLFNRFLLAVDDPVRMSRNLIRVCGHPAGEPIAVAGVVGREDDKYRMVFFDPLQRIFFYRPRRRGRREVSWTWIREQAMEGRTGGPSGTLEYLLMAASGIYLLADPLDGYNHFERQAREIHLRYTGVAFPYVSFGIEEGATGTVQYLQIYTREYEEWSREVEEQFFR